MKRVMIVAGEASGDFHAANLVQAVHRTAPDVHFYGIGGAHMREAGVEVQVDAGELAVVGLVEVLAHYRVIKGALEQMRRRLREDPPDLLVLTDYPDFNLRLAKTAHECGVKVLYYISPQVWAWRQGRVKQIRERVDMMAVVFAFEADFYREHDVPVRFVGHPLVDEVAAEDPRPRAALRESLGLDPDRPVVGLFPGSRRGEIRRLLPVLLAAARRLREELPQAQFVLPRASSLSEADLRPWLEAAGLPVQVVAGRGHDVMRACDAIATASGTVTLEIALIGTPMVLIYKVAPLTYSIVRRLLKIDHIGLCNIVTGERIAPELVQGAATPEAIAAELRRFLTEPAHAERVRADLGRVRKALGGTGGTANAARLLVEMLAAPANAARA